MEGLLLTGPTPSSLVSDDAVCEKLRVHRTERDPFIKKIRKSWYIGLVETRSRTPKLAFKAPSLTTYGPKLTNNFRTPLYYKMPPLSLQNVSSLSL